MATTKKTGVLLANLGSPTAPTTKAVGKFLKDFLGDPRVVNIPRPIWLFILHCFVLPFRPAKSAKAYQKVWTEKGSPLMYLTRQFAEKLASQFSAQGTAVTYAMRYGEPSIARQLNWLRQEGVERFVILPLYPQYSSTTTASIYDDVVKEFNSWRHLPDFTFVADYYRHDSYIEAIANTVKTTWQAHGKHEMLLMSFHGLPELLIKLGDPYFHQCQETARRIAEKLGLDENNWLLVFQSRFGKAEWLKPYCVDTLEKLPGQGIKTLDVICPGFAVDCLETLEEMAMENKSVFMAAGGTDYRYIPALNDSETHVLAISALLEEWI